MGSEPGVERRDVGVARCDRAWAGRRARGRGAILAILVVVFIHVALAEDVAPTASAATPPEPATLQYFNQDIVTLRAPRNGRTPTERVAAIHERITAALAEQPDAQVTLDEDEQGVALLLGKQQLLVLTRRDVDPDAGEHLFALADHARDALNAALAASRVQSRPDFLLRALGFAVLATIAFAVIGWVTLRGRRWLAGAMPRAARAISERLAFGGRSVLQPMVVAQSLRSLVNLVALSVLLFALYLWLTFVLQLFPYTEPWGRALGSYLKEVAGTVGLGIVSALPGLVFVLIIIVITRFLSRVMHAVFDAIRRERIHVPGLYPDTAEPTQKIATALLWIFALVLAYPYLPGSGTEAFKAVGVFAGLLISLGSAGVVGQVMSGFVLMYSRALREGEYVRIREVEGTVREVGLLSTKIETPKREEITIPNGVLVSNEIRNFSRLAASQGALIFTTVTIGYDTPWRQVEAMLLEAARRIEGIRRQPPPFVMQTALADFYAEYQLNVFIKSPEARVRTLASLHAAIQDVFNEFGVQIMSPHYVADPGERKLVDRANWYAAPASEPAAPSPPAP
jgi:small-conductance mechanosensitive channel